MEKNQIINNVTVVDYSFLGQGVVKVDNFAIFVKSAVVGQVLDIKLLKVSKKFAFARIEKIVSDVSAHVAAKCSVYSKCGGCQIQHLSYEEQLNFKASVVKNLLDKAKITTKINRIIANDAAYEYRNKISLPFQMINGQVKLGFYKERSNDLVTFDTCHLQSKLANQILKDVEQLMDEVGETCYNRITKKGNLRHLFIRESAEINAIMLVFVINQKKIRNLDLVIEKLTSKYPEIKTISLNINKNDNNVILGPDNQIMFGEETITMKLQALNLKLRTNDFFQINVNQTINLYNEVKRHLTPNDQLVLDAYSGVGSIGLFIADAAKSVVGVEIVESAVISATENAKLNNIDNVSFECKNMNEYQNVEFPFDTVIVDPPRSGLDSNFIQLLNEKQPNKIIYVSCNPNTFVQNVTELLPNYQLVSVTPVDMFSQTHHIEVVGVLEKNK
ncbi:MAG: 23S rRNA (uracil(1939)-C(5))-methyltransferase RlmD [Mycoplasmatales bacterium]